MGSKAPRVLAYAAFVTALALAPRPAWPDQAAGALQGVVTAADGARLPGVALRLVHTDTGRVYEATSGEAGAFRVGDLARGAYRLRAELPGFEPREIDMTVGSGGPSLPLIIQLQVASVREQVRVIGTAPGESIEAYDLRSSRARDLGEAMTLLPGVSRLRKGGIANDVVVRGFQGKDVTVLIDGQRLDGACPGHMDPPAFHVDFAEVSRVEMIRGPFDVKNQGGLAGTINVVTERPQRGWHATSTLSIASASTLAASVSASVGGRAWAALAGASSRHADPYADGAGVPFTAGAGYAVAAAAGRRAYDVWTAWSRGVLVPRDATTVQASFARQSAGTILYPYLQMDALFDRATRTGVRAEAATLPGGWQAAALHVYHTGVDHWMTDELRTSGSGRPRPYSMATRARTSVAGARAEVHREPFSFGFEASRRYWDTSMMLAMRDYAPQNALPDVTSTVMGGFLSYQASPHPQWQVEAGARADRAVMSANPGDGNRRLYAAYYGSTTDRVVDVLPALSVRATFRAERGWLATAGLGHRQRLPDQQERFYALARAGSDWVGNPGLRPSKNTGAEGEWRYARRGVDVGVVAFVYRVDDDILVVDRPRQTAVPGVMNPIARSYANLDALVRGFEIRASAPLAARLSVAADASAVRGTSRSRTAPSSDLPEIPPAQARVRLRFIDRRWSAAAELAGSAAQTHVATALRELPTAAYAVANLRVSARWRPLEVSLAADNVFDSRYAEHLSYQRDPFRTGFRVYEPGRTLSLTLSASF